MNNACQAFFDKIVIIFKKYRRIFHNFVEYILINKVKEFNHVIKALEGYNAD